MQDLGETLAAMPIQDLVDDVQRKPRKFKIADILRIVAENGKVTVEQLKSPWRDREVALTRQMVYFLCREKTAASFPMIGRALNRDHSSACVGSYKYLCDHRGRYPWLAELEARCIAALDALPEVEVVTPPVAPSASKADGRHVRWTDVELELLRKQFNRATYKELSRTILSRHTPNSIRHKVYALGLLESRVAA